jgi:hypothetical protein
MCCNLPVQEGVKSASDCKCYKAVMQAYGTLVAAGQPERVALEAARIVYNYHHPEDLKPIAALTVERWINETRIH